MSFDKNSILTIANAEQLREGKKGWAANSLPSLISKVYIDSPTMVTLSNDDSYPFKVGVSLYTLFYPAPESFKMGDIIVVISGKTIPIGTIATVLKSKENSLTMDIMLNNFTYLVSKEKCKRLSYKPLSWQQQPCYIWLADGPYFAFQIDFCEDGWSESDDNYMYMAMRNDADEPDCEYFLTLDEAKAHCEKLYHEDMNRFARFLC